MDLTLETTQEAIVELVSERISLTVAGSATPPREALIADVRRGLGAPRKWMPPRWFYDDRGSELFEQITRLPEYYQTRTEAAILQSSAAHLAAATHPATLVELGAGSCTKTRILIREMLGRGLERFVPVDVSDATLTAAARRLTGEFATLRVDAVVGDFADALSVLPVDERQCILFLGSTIGNLLPHERVELFSRVRSRLGSRGTFVLGVDLVKPVEALHAAYNDSAGVTAAFNRNLLSVLNAELDADFDLDAFEHVALYDVDLERIEMHLRSCAEQWVDIPGASMQVHFGPGETVLTETSAKFTHEGVDAELSRAGMRCIEWIADHDERFALALCMPA